MMRMGRVVLVLVVLIAVGQFLLPAAAEQGLEQALRKTYPQAGLVDVEVEAVPAVKLLAGRADRIKLSLTDIDTAPVSVAAFNAALERVSIDLKELILYRRIMVKSRNEEFRAVVREEAINEYIDGQRIPVLNQVRVKLEDDNAKLLGEITIIGRALTLAVNGSLTLTDGKILFRPESVEINDAEYTSALRTKLLRSVGFTVPVQGLPLEVFFTGLEQQPGQIILSGTATR